VWLIAEVPDASSHRSVLDLLLAAAQNHGEQPAFRSPAGITTYADWLRDATARVEQLLAAGVGEGDRFAIRGTSADWLTYAGLFFAGQLIGAIPVSLPMTMAAHAETSIVDALDVRATLTCDRGELTIERQLQRSRKQVRIDPEWDIATILPTSGTTGRSRVVLISSQNLLSTLSSQPQHSTERLLYQPVIGSHLAQVALLRPLAPDHPQCIIATSADPELLFKSMESAGATQVTIFPHVARALCHWMIRTSHTAPVTIRSVTVTGDSSSPELLQTLAGCFPRAEIRNFYTSTEAYPAALSTVFDARCPKAVGKPDRRRTDVLVDGAGPVGEVLLRSLRTEPRRFASAPEWSVEDVTDDWVRTGDSGYFDPEGRLVLTGRRGDSVQIGGSAVSILEVEREVLSVQGVNDAAVVKVEGARNRVSLLVHVTLDGGLSEDVLRDAIRARFPSSFPLRLKVVEVVTRNVGGKVARIREEEPPSESRELAAIAKLWTQVLELESSPSAEDDFLLLGGDSLSYSELSVTLGETLGVSVPVDALMRAETLGAMAAMVSQRTPRSVRDFRWAQYQEPN
jgi:long-chain acyl-CoA synthetase